MTALGQLFVASLLSPRDAAHRLLGQGLDARAGVLGLLATVILGVLVLFGLNGFAPVRLLPGMDPISPLVFAAMVLVTNLLLILALLLAGRMFGGTAGLADGLVLFAWLQFMQLGLQICTTILAFVLGPVLGAPVAFVAMIIIFWMFFNFILVWQNFDSMWKAVVTVFLALLAISFVFSNILLMAGGMPAGAGL